VGVATVVVGASYWCHSDRRCDLFCKHDCIDEAARRYLAVLHGAYQWLQPGADPLVPYGRDPPRPDGPAT